MPDSVIPVYSYTFFVCNIVTVCVVLHSLSCISHLNNSFLLSHVCTVIPRDELLCPVRQGGSMGATDGSTALTACVVIARGSSIRAVRGQVSIRVQQPVNPMTSHLMGLRALGLCRSDTARERVKGILQLGAQLLNMH